MSESDALAAKLDRITVLLVALLVVELYQLVGGIASLSFLALFLFASGLVVVFFLALAATF